ncbi:MAG: amidohydrolase family protein [Gammaproteobacteria bacterium]|nr:amidohydrolase family protein [Gammaproteobacteria bacterium]
MAYDLVIRNGTLVDGTGASARSGDVAVQGDRIVAVGQVGAKGRREIDASGKIVTPGFVDIHTHLDAQIAWDPIASSSCYHGVTSVVIGNCGVTFAPCKPEDRGYLAEMMESVEDIPKESIDAGLPWDWETYGEYLESLDRMDKGVNVGGMVGHCAVRIHAMGERSLDETPASDEDVQRMCELVDEAIAAGALGFSTSRTFLHKVPDGRYVPGTHADPSELLAIGRVLGRRRKGIFEGALRIGERDREEHLPKTRAEIAWVGQLSRENNVRVTFGLAHSYRRPDLYRRVIGFAEEENANGAQLRPQTSSRGIGGLFGLDHRTPFNGSAAWRELGRMPFAQRLAALEDESFRVRLLEVESPPVIDLENAYILTDDDLDYVHDRSRSLTAYAERTGQGEVAAFIELNRRHQGRVQLWHPGLNQSMDAIEEMITNPTVAMGLGDSGAHVGQIMDASSPTWLLSYWVKNRGVMSLEEAIRGWTGDTAAIFGIKDRGVLREGTYADINVIDFDNLAMELPEYKHDFPAGAGRYVQRGRGYEQVIVNGELFMEHGEHTGALAGRTLRS